jgi:(p)ppGpp synthase/HD superfamily hydrolase
MRSTGQVTQAFAEEKDNILSWYILHHAVDDNELQELSTRLTKAVEVANRLHAGSLRKTGEPYIYHPLRTAMEVSRFGRIVDWPSIEAAILHDTVEDTDYSIEELRRDFPESAELVEALTKIKDDKELTYRRLFEYALKDIRVLLIKIADRVDNLGTLHIFSPEKRLRIARESATMYANTCERLCMLDLASRLREQVGEYLTPEKYAEFQEAQKKAKKELERPLVHLRSRLAEVFPGDLTVRIDIHWNRFDHTLPVINENLFTVRIIAESREAAYQALGRVHISFPAIPGTFKDNISNPRENGFRALETSISNRGMIVRFYIASREDDRYNRLGLLSMDVESAHFNTRYLKDLREFLEAEDFANIQDYLRFNLPDGIQVTTPKGETVNLEVGATALDFAFALHKGLGLRATGAIINDIPTSIATKLKMNDRVFIKTADRPVANEKFQQWATTRRAMSAIKRYLRQEELRKASEEGKKLLLGVGTAAGMDSWEVDNRVKALAAQSGEKTDKIYEEVFFGKMPLEKVLGPLARPGWNPVSALLQKVMPPKPVAARTVRRYDFSSNLRFCTRCVPVPGDEIEGVAGERALTVHRKGCFADDSVPRVTVEWDRQKKIELRDPGPVKLEIVTTPTPGLIYKAMAPFRSLEIEINSISLPGEDNILHLEFSPGTSRALDRLLRELRKLEFVREIELGHSEAHH